MKIWIDFTAAAHPLVLRPVIERFRAEGHEVEITARDYGQTLGVIERLGHEFTAVGRHGGAGRVSKAAALAGRTARLLRWARGRGFGLAVAHGSVDLALVSAALRIPAAEIHDYEWATAQHRIGFRAARRVITPDAIPVERLLALGAKRWKIAQYPGIKEDYYLADLVPDPAVLAELGLDRERVIVVVRPPPEVSMYHAANDVFGPVLQRIGRDSEVEVVVIPRTEEQRAAISAAALPSVRIPERAIDAQSLIAHADLVISAGGTMNREAVALGTPAYTTFSGRIGGVDEALIAEGLLRPLHDPADVELRKRELPVGPRNPRDPQLLADLALAAADPEDGSGDA